MLTPRTDDFPRLAREALRNEPLRRALLAANESFKTSRERAVAELPDWQELREQGREIKARALEALPWALEDFERAVVERGGTVHWAADAGEACRIVSGIARSRGVRTAVKSKSMATEEIGLNRALEACGVEAVETDLGEYIIQLAGETPSHIIAPAIHKRRGEIARLFAERLGVSEEADIPEMASAARRELRRRFLEAEMGISGANFLVAETGTIVIVENEGNARLVTTLPRVHVVVAGIEKVVPRREDLAVLLRLLTRSATGQRITSYVSFIEGPGEGGGHGPEELHVVLLDNGRTRMWLDPRYREALRCIRCGACLNYCPIYEHVGGHAYGWVYPGPIGSVITPHFVGLDRARHLPYASSLCGRCGEVCPVKIPLPDLLLDLRARAVEREGSPLGERLGMRIYAFLAVRPRLWRIALACVRALMRLPGANAVLRRFGPAARWYGGRELPSPQGPPFRVLWRRGEGRR